MCFNRSLISFFWPEWCSKAKRKESESSATGIGRQTSRHASGWWSRASKIVDNCSCLTIFKRTGRNYHSMTVQSNSLSRGAEANVSHNQERAHQKGEPIWAVKYRDEQWADSFALCQNLLENHETPLRQASSFISSFHLFLFFFIPAIHSWSSPAVNSIFFCSVHLPRQKHIHHTCLVFKQSVTQQRRMLAVQCYNSYFTAIQQAKTASAKQIIWV